MRRLLILLLWMCCGVGHLSADIIARAQVVRGDQPIWVGQRVLIQVDALSSDGWVGMSKIDFDEVPGALVLDRNPRGITISDRVGGSSHPG